MSIVSERLRAEQRPSALPRAPRSPAAPNDSPATEQIATQEISTARRVIVAGRDAGSRKEITLTLMDAGFDVVGQATDGHQLSALAGALRPELIIIDIDNAMEGLDIATRLALSRVTPVVLLGSDLERDIGYAVDAGVMAVVRKPCSRSNLVPAIEMAAARFADASTLRADVAHLGRRLDTRKIVDRAKGLLMERTGMTEPAAYRWLQTTAMDQRTSMRKVAEVTIEGLSKTG